jgi:hypothetical protein
MVDSTDWPGRLNVEHLGHVVAHQWTYDLQQNPFSSKIQLLALQIVIRLVSECQLILD